MPAYTNVAPRKARNGISACAGESDRTPPGSGRSTQAPASARSRFGKAGPFLAISLPASGVGLAGAADTRGMQPQHLHALGRDIVTRAIAIVGLAGIALIHLLDSIGKYGETRYLFWMYVALIVGCIAVAGLVLFTRSRGAFLAAAALAGSALLGYVLSRTTGLPNATDDVGNWTEPLGLASLFVEGGVVAVALTAYFRTRGLAPAPARREATVPR